TPPHTKADGAFPTLVLGNAADAEVLLRAMESGAVTRIRPVGVLSPSRSDRGQAIRGIAVLGDLEDLESVVSDLAERGTNITRVILTPTVLGAEARPEGVLMRARRLGLATSRLPALDQGGEALRLAPVAVEDLLLRPSVKIDYRRLENFVKGKAVVVTGGGGSIGAEICERLGGVGGGRVVGVENGGAALDAGLWGLSPKGSAAMIHGRLRAI